MCFSTSAFLSSSIIYNFFLLSSLKEFYHPLKKYNFFSRNLKELILGKLLLYKISSLFPLRSSRFKCFASAALFSWLSLSVVQSKDLMLIRSWQTE